MNNKTEKSINMQNKILHTQPQYLGTSKWISMSPSIKYDLA